MKTLIALCLLSAIHICGQSRDGATLKCSVQHILLQGAIGESIPITPAIQVTLASADHGVASFHIRFAVHYDNAPDYVRERTVPANPYGDTVEVFVGRFRNATLTVDEIKAPESMELVSVR